MGARETDSVAQADTNGIRQFACHDKHNSTESKDSVSSEGRRERDNSIKEELRPITKTPHECPKTDPEN